MTMTIVRPNTPARAALTAKAKLALTMTRYDIATTRRYLVASGAVLAGAELAALGLVTVVPGKDLALDRRFVVTGNGDIMREYLLRENALRKLAKVARDNGITGEDLADVAAAVDAGQEECVGVSVEFYWPFQLRAELDRSSGEDLRQDLQRVLGW